MTYSLANAELRHRKFPKTFSLPSRKVRDSLQPGHFAKVILDGKERMWVEVTRVVEPGVYVGKLRNTPTRVKSVKFGSTIRFSAKNIIAVTR